MTALETLKCYTHGKKNTDKVEISVWALNRIINALTQECVDPTQKHVGNVLDMRCDDAEQIDYHDDFETASRKIHDYEERQKQNDKKCCSDCQVIGTDSCYMVCGGSKSLYKPKQKQEPQCTEHPCLGTLCRYYKQPCDDTISRILKRMWNCRGKHTTSIDKVAMEQIIRDELSVTQKSIECDDTSIEWYDMEGYVGSSEK